MPKHAIVASGNTATPAPPAAARATASSISERLSDGTAVDVIWHSAIRT